MASTNATTSSNYWDFLFTELADPRTNHWPLISSPVPGLTIIASYLYFVLNFGPKYMANRKPFQMQKTLVVYNFIQVLVSIYLFAEVCFGVRSCCTRFLSDGSAHFVCFL